MYSQVELQPNLYTHASERLLDVPVLCQPGVVQSDGVRQVESLVEQVAELGVRQAAHLLLVGLAAVGPRLLPYVVRGDRRGQPSEVVLLPVVGGGVFDEVHLPALLRVRREVPVKYVRDYFGHEPFLARQDLRVGFRSERVDLRRQPFVVGA